MKHQYIYVYALLLICLVPSSLVFAQGPGPIPIAELRDSEFREGFRDRLSVSSSVVLGLALGSSTGVRSRYDITINRSGLPDAGEFCIRVITADGLFWAENAYVDESLSSFVRTSPLSRNYTENLSQYKVEDILVTAGFGVSGSQPLCSQQGLAYAPLVTNPATSYDQLTVFINSESRFTRAELWTMGTDDPQPLPAEAECKKAEASFASIYDKRCVFDLAGITHSGLTQLKLRFQKVPFGFDKWSETLILPPNLPTSPNDE